MHPVDRISNAKAVVKLLQDLLAGIQGGVDLTPEAVYGFFILLQAIYEELEAAKQACEEWIKNAA